MVTESIPEEDGSEAENRTFEAELHTSSLLGMQCNMAIDTLGVRRRADNEVPNKITQIALFSFLASFFDPVGRLTPYTMRMRNLLR